MARLRPGSALATPAQKLIFGGWLALMAAVVGVWTLVPADGPGATLLSLGRLAGLLATYFALTQFMLMARILWIERVYGLDRLARFHRFNGYATIILLILHPILIIGSHAAELDLSFFQADIWVITHHDDIIKAYIGLILFIVVVASSIYIVRKKLRYEAWYFVHLSVYAAIILAAGHQFSDGETFLVSPAARVFWYALYAFVALNVIGYRIVLPAVDYFRYRFTVSRVERESPSVASVYIKARDVGRMTVKPGQFVFVRFLARGFWWQEHPYTVSLIPKDGELRISVRDSGDFSHAVPGLTPGTRVSVSGPFGRFTSDVAVKEKRLLVAGGIGVTPLRALFEAAAANGTPTLLVWANKSAADVPLRAEIDELSAGNRHLSVRYVFSDGPDGRRVDTDYLVGTVPDIRERDIYVCGPPAMQQAIVDGLLAAGIDGSQIHYESFALAG